MELPLDAMGYGLYTLLWLMVTSLTEIESRVIGCLVEKSITTPEYYPLTLNSLTAACNQKSNRDPEMDLTEKQVTDALDNLRYNHHLVWHVTSTGSRVPKYKHDIIDVIGLSDAELALLCVLMLRGPQTPGELRSRTSRLHNFESLAEIATILDEMHHRETGALVVKLPREPGSREQRYMHLLCGDAEQPSDAAPGPQADTAAQPQTNQEHAVEPNPLEDEISRLRTDLENLKAEFETFRQRFE